MAWTTPGTATAGSVLTASFLNTNVRDNTNALYTSMRRLDYQTVSSSYAITSTTVAGASEMFTDLSFTADGTSSYLVEHFVPTAISGTSNYTNACYLCKGDGTIIVCMASAMNAVQRSPVGVLRYYYTPAAGTQTLNIRWIKETGSANGNIELGAAPIGGGNYSPAYLAVFGPPML